MKHSDFYIGLEFIGSGGFRWRCTDVGLRTIAAILLDQDDPNWYQGPPYIAAEIVFDEQEIERSHLTETDAILSAMDGSSGHPGYPGDVINKMMKARLEAAKHPPLRKGVLRFDRLTLKGEILHPYSVRKDDEGWMVLVYLPFRHEFSEMLEQEFIALPIANAADIKARAAADAGR